MRKFEFNEIQKAFTSGSISLMDFSSVLVDNLGKKKARKVLKRNLELSLKEEGCSKEDIEEYLKLVTLLVHRSDHHLHHQSPDFACGFD
jgi:hypothetical protein